MALLDLLGAPYPLACTNTCIPRETTPDCISNNYFLKVIPCGL